ncbi:30S ribosomal protein S12 methylthiotransferase RimO [Desulforhopalus singaporensis]|uniref:Ribosomal protein uS12 methylthiotransferase RimO n=1 Tax=Desulforhopalus singaporensis TaxID=91360 RepID=A0A1H0JRI1_9BACT|nr:30S ribosomal protein S12 methylthiotransferase RimO [Desulforhopalus singaporensis]SDO46336.1 SSU ribosomal protein S12P methylthiotransferase [Desulforhopalus singaporensis]
MSTFHLVSLGCAKNLVDSEVILGALDQSGWQLCEDPELADVIIINTCGFIQPAVEEAIDEILAMANIKKSRPGVKLVVCGCLVQRYRESLAAELPEVDLFLGTEAVAMVPELLDKKVYDLSKKVILPPQYLMDAATPRIISTPGFRAWLKITEGCDNRCSYCMIPSIRGRLRSRPIDDLVAEATNLERAGVKELSLIAQDITAYGNDLGRGTSLEKLLEQLLQKTSIPWIRLLYLYPTGISRKLIELVVNEQRIVPYLDIPFQHVSDNILKKMNRPYGYRQLAELVEKLRGEIPDIALRTTFLVGFPGETEHDLGQLEQFMSRYKLDHVGVFAYANEPGAPSENFPGQLEEDEKNRRRDHLMGVQAELSGQVQQKYVGQTVPVLVEGVCRETELLLEGRTKYQAPEVDGCVYINEGTAAAGDIVNVRIEEAKTYDLIGGIVA